MKLYKYRTCSEIKFDETNSIFERDLVSLNINKIWSSPFEALDDVFENNCELEESLRKLQNVTVPKSNKIGSINNVLTNIKNVIEKSKSFGVISFGEKYDNELLWALYADNNKGYCIEYDSSILLDYELEFETIFKVKYQQGLPKVNIEDILDKDFENSIMRKIVGTKKLAWRGQDEFRVVTGVFGEFEYFYNAVTAIYFGLDCSLSSIDVIQNTLKGRGVRYFKIAKDKYELIPILLKDEYSDAPKYIDNYAPIGAGCAELDKELDMEYHNVFMDKAIEIVRKYDYCKSIIDHSISRTKSKGTNIVYFVCWERKDGKYITEYFSQDELANQ